MKVLFRNLLVSIKQNTKASKVVWAVFLACVTAFMGLGLVDPILPIIAQQLGASKIEVSMLFTAYSAVMAVTMLVTATISKRVGIKRTLLVGVSIIAIFSILCGLSNDIWSIIFLRGFWGLGNALFIAVALTAIILFSDKTTHESVILYEIAIGLGFSVGPLVGGLLGDISWKFPFFGVGILMMMGFIMLLVLIPKSTTKEIESYDDDTSLVTTIKSLKNPHIKVFGTFSFLYNF
ncbi:multidrug efflux protein YfmO [Methanobrevibacter cuticularis]|uniref:Multidrug efflux protein YfmO n=1 Tax=Methanobrevibacter cuticularis TaxID=47311 RepID=A0A166DTZ6_9EURY|nr:MFS transporter [Methanobrevibacter cuticularis]KZX15949.1 multidrug efflux protein YfmO [Methanobrevibacter cuticularis]